MYPTFSATHLHMLQVTDSLPLKKQDPCTHSPVVSHWFAECVAPWTWAWPAELSLLSANGGGGVCVCVNCVLITGAAQYSRRHVGQAAQTDAHKMNVKLVWSRLGFNESQRQITELGLKHACPELF